MTITLRIDDKLLKEIENYIKEIRISRSDFIRIAIIEKLAKKKDVKWCIFFILDVDLHYNRCYNWSINMKGRW